LKKNDIVDEIDLKIIELLVKDSRITYRDISKEINIGLATVSRRIKNLEENKIITKYTTILDYSKLGKKCLMCCFIQIKSGSNIEKLAQQISKYEDVQNICYIAGDFELSIIANCKDQEEAIQFISQLSKISEVNRIVPHTIFKKYK
jgi:DNA-binding Lrp family transcriptional regulator